MSAALWAAFTAADAGIGTALWRLDGALPWPAGAFMVLVALVLPAITVAQRRQMDEVVEHLSRPAVYLSSALALWLLALLGAAAALASGLTLRTLGLVLSPIPLLIGWSLAAFFAYLILLAAGRALRIRETGFVRWLLPRTPGERLGFAALSVTAGITEEFVFRGFLIPALTVVVGSVWASGALSSALFGLLHAYQGWPGTVRAGLMGLILALPFLLTGSIVPGMIAHALVNIVAGIWFADSLLGRGDTAGEK